METVLVTVPQRWDPKSSFAVDGLHITEWAKQQKDSLDVLLHQKGFRVKCMTSYIYQGVSMIHYALEKEDNNV